MPQSRSILAALSVAGLAMITHAAPADARVVCRTMVWGYGTHANKNIAKVQALGAWNTKVKSQHGAGFANYASAKSKSQSCRSRNPVGSSFECVVKGRPCMKSVGPSGKKGG
jgi:hypothetical protein